jgi:hypothetical protein
LVERQVIGGSASDVEVGEFYDSVFGGVKSVEDVFVEFDSKVRLAGHGVKTNDNCGKFRFPVGCLRGKNHDFVDLATGVNHAGKGWVKPVFFSCDKVECPTCFKYGWASREARKVEYRLLEAQKRFGLVEHFPVSFPESDYVLGVDALYKRAVRACSKRGIIGGCAVFHGYRFHHANETFVGEKPRWFRAYHFHVLGFVRGGMKCRGCCNLPKERRFFCRGCEGFFGVSMREYDSDGLIVELARDKFGKYGERKSVGGTAWYQLHHSCFEVGKKRNNVVRWFGVCSYRKLKLAPMPKRLLLCPLCGEPLYRVKCVACDHDVATVGWDRRGFEVNLGDWEVVTDRGGGYG